MDHEEADIPKSMVFKLGKSTNHDLQALVKDLRKVMQPHTAIKLKERKTNKLKDFVVMARPLGVSHLMILTQSEDSGNILLKLAKTPQGPTLTFKIKSFSLCSDIVKSLRHPKTLNAGDEMNPPLLVMNNFTASKEAEPKEALLTSMFQNMFPPISVQGTKLNTIRRVLLLNKDKETGVIDLRHYYIETKLVGVSRAVKRLAKAKKMQKTLPNLSSAQDFESFMNGDYGASSESEMEDETNTFEDEVGKEQVKQKRAVKLTEIGPRMLLELRKIEDGICEGKTLYHSTFSKTAQEEQELQERHDKRKQLKEERRAQQAENVKRKKEKETRSSRGKKRARIETGETEDKSGSDVDDAPEELFSGDDEDGDDEEGYDASDEDSD